LRFFVVGRVPTGGVVVIDDFVFVLDVFTFFTPLMAVEFLAGVAFGSG